LSYLLDTCVVSELVKPRPDRAVMRWIAATPEPTLHLSVLTLGEIAKGIAKLGASKRRAALEAWLATDLRARFAGRIVPVDDAVAELWGRVMADAEMRGAPLPVVDALIAATGRRSGMTVVTRNEGHIRRAGADVVNPWVPP
jgi:predicted nucleic acid-binding protein